MDEPQALQLMRRKAEEMREALKRLESGNTFTAKQVREMLELAAKDAGSQIAFAQNLGLSSAFVSAVINGRKAPTGDLLKFLGLRKVVTYEPVSKDEA